MTRSDNHTLIWTGSYTADSGGHGAGIGAVSANPDATLTWLGTAAKADSPSFIAVHPSLPVVYAVGETAKTVQAYRRRGEFGLEAAGEPWAAGEAACHVAVDPGGRFLIVACWGDGQVLLYELDADGGMTARYSAEPSVDPRGDAETDDGGRPSRAHASLMLADGRIMTTDLGHDLLRVWNYVPGAGLAADHEVMLPKGSGPRHLVQHPGGTVFVVSEYSIEVFAVRAASDTGGFELVGRGPATTGGAQEGDSAAEIALAPDGRHAYVGVRGSNRISVLQVEDGTTDGTTGQLRPLGDFASGGDWPRHHLVRNGWLHVAHERSHDVTTFRLDPDTGLPGDVRHRLVAGSPTALVVAS
ncbi:beta-propeller fold lactonase family protein [Arthrobacter sp. ISL-5]|uniref:lactonase family protein n=1 Tax=Arthrobacter sp. ISL-5 TaxID=2819111 RepID=UPI001BE9F8FB|nr:beta-propeller fold lactonase family protein [Arthrobacter sp. ISL-5]MBT2555365.1 beta-propeller fold lactonase family protein [Arthrobacter sp. ISL-5]